jgi:hypothetical protein
LVCIWSMFILSELWNGMNASVDACDLYLFLCHCRVYESPTAKYKSRP